MFYFYFYEIHVYSLKNPKSNYAQAINLKFVRLNKMDERSKALVIYSSCIKEKPAGEQKEIHPVNPENSSH